MDGYSSQFGIGVAGSRPGRTFLVMPHMGLEPGTSGSGFMCDDS